MKEKKELSKDMGVVEDSVWVADEEETRDSAREVCFCGLQSRKLSDGSDEPPRTDSTGSPDTKADSGFDSDSTASYLPLMPAIEEADSTMPELEESSDPSNHLYDDCTYVSPTVESAKDLDESSGEKSQDSLDLEQSTSEEQSPIPLAENSTNYEVKNIPQVKPDFQLIRKLSEAEPNLPKEFSCCVDKVTFEGWLYGIIDGRTGIFPCEYVLPLGRNEMHTMKKEEKAPQKIYSTNTMHSETTTVQESRVVHRELAETTWSESHLPPDYPDDKSDISHMTQVNDGKHSLLQFALLNFRQSLDKYEMLRTADGSIRGSLKMIESLKSKKKGKKGKDSDWTWKEQVEMVKYTKSPIQASLLKLESSELNKLALECFIAIMRYMGDYPMAKNQTDVDCVYTILMNCHRHHQLRDEVYCQIMKQTTNNKSPKPDSCQKGWRLFSIIGAYFDCSDLLKPYLFKYLETAAYDKRRAYHGTAMVCLQNLRKTFKYGGRKNVPSIEEITAITAGRNSKRQIYRLPGGTERVINTKSTSVVADIIEEICTHLNIRSIQEMEEFSLYCIVEGDTFTMPLAREEYILDVTTELHKNQQVFYLIFCRSVWYYPLRLDSQLYIEVVFNQIAPDYLEGLLLVTPGDTIPSELAYDIAKVAALLHRATNADTVPSIKETKYLLPKPAINVRDIKPPQWVNMVQGNWREVEMLTPTESKAQVLEILQKWPLFGSSFFAVKKLGDGRERSDFILALNRNGVHFLDILTHETLYHYPFSEVISTRKVKAEDGTLFLDMKVGNLMVQKITRIQTDQAHEISRLIKQYIMIEQKNRGVRGDTPKDVTLTR